MKKLLVLLLVVAPLSIFAQQKFAYVNAPEIMQQMPEYSKATKDIQLLEKQYSDELQHMRTELEKKGIEFEQVKDSLPENILQRRYTEIQELSTRMEQYYQESLQNLQQAQQAKIAEVTTVLTKAIQEAGREGGYICVFDIAGGIPYISETQCEDITAKVKTKLGIGSAVLGK